MNNKKKIILGSIIGIMLGLLISTTYAIFSYNKLGNNNQIIAGDIYMHYNESNTLTLENALPSSTYDPNNYFEFTIKGKNTNTKYNIVYDINLNYGDEIDNKIRIQDRFLKFRLVEVINNEETELLTDKLYLSIDNKRIYVSTINKNTNTEITRVYRLYVWIDKNVVIGNTDYSDYSISDWNNVYGSVKVSVTGDFSEKEIQTEPYLVMKNLNGIQDWNDIRANITSVEFHTDGIIPNDAITSFDVTDETSSGDVTLYTVDDGLDSNTYKAIVVGDDIIYAPTSCRYLFMNMTNLVKINSKNFKVDNVTNMGQMFENCVNLINIESLESWNTSNVTRMYTLFSNCHNLVNISSLKYWNVSKVTMINKMFYKCNKLINIDAVSNWNVSNVTNMHAIFFDCTSLQDISGLSNWNTSNVTSMYNMFTGCISLQDINGLSNWNVSNVTNMSNMLSGCNNLEDVSGLKNWNVEKVENMDNMFTSCINLEEIDLSNWKTTSLTNMINMFGMWNNDSTARTDSKLKRIILSDKFDTSKVTDMYALFANNTLIEDYSFLEYFDTKNVQNMSQMFQNNFELTNQSLEYISNWNVENATDMIYMFGRCISLTDASVLNNWNINSNTNFTNMFKGVPSHPEFTQVAGTWDSDGTFTPTL